MALQTLRDFEIDPTLKATLQSRIYRISMQHYGIISSSNSVSGPPIERHIVDARMWISTTKDSKVTIVEIDEEVLIDKIMPNFEALKSGRIRTWDGMKHDGVLNNYDTAQMMPITHNVEFKCCDIAEAKPVRFVDADLMSTWWTCGESIEKALIRQREAFPTQDKIKCFLFTVASARQSTVAETIEWITSYLLPVVGSDIKIDPKIKENLTVHPDSRTSNNGTRSIYVHAYPPIVNLHAGNTQPLKGFHLYSYNDGGGHMMSGLIAYR